MKMKIPVRRSCLTLIVLSAFVEAIRANENGNSTESRRGRVSGRIVKLYSGYKPDPVLCVEEGFKEDPVQCSVFYRCVKSSSGKFTVYKFQCGPGTVYDPETEVCNHPSSTKRSECGGLKLQAEQNNENEINEIELSELPSPISTILPVYTSHANNNTSYKVPANSTPITSGLLMQSTENGYFTSFTTSTPYKLETTTKDVKDINYNSWTNYKNTTEHKVVSSTTTFPVLEKSQSCTADGFMGDSENCKKFYRCVSNFRGGFIRYEFVCSEPTVWDDHMQSCNHPWAVRNSRCGRSGLNNEKLTYEPTIQTSEHFGDKHSETSDQNIIDDSKREEQPLHYGDRLNNEDDKYLEKDQAIYGSNLNQQTTPDKDTNLEKEPTVHMEGTENINSYNLVQTTTAQSIYSTGQNSELQSKQDFHCTQSGFVGDSQDCKKFYRCVENGRGSFTKYEFTCSQGTVWDNKIEACNHAWAVKECGDRLFVQSSSVTAETLISTTTSANTANSDSDNLDNGYANQISQQYEPSTTVTVSTPVSLISTTVDSNQIGTETECTTAGFNGDKDDCKKFYRCVDNGKGTFTKYEYKCGDGTLWDQNIEACNHAWAVKSCNTDLSNSNIINMSTTLSTASLIQSTTQEKSEDNSYNEAYGPEKDRTTLDPGKDLPVTTAPAHKNDCESTGFMGDTNDCKKFYRCVNNGQRGFIKYEFSCGDGTVWDPEIEACNHAWAVKHCGTSIKQDTASSSTPSSSNHPVTNGNDIGLTTSPSLTQTSTPQKEIIEYDSGYGQQHSVSTMKPDLEMSTSKQINNQTNNCVTSGFMGDVNNCNKFYRCVDNGNGGFIQHEFSCGEGTAWDPEIDACNHAWAVKTCESHKPSKENILTSSTQLNVVQSSSEHLTQNNIENEYTTPYSNFQTTKVPNVNDDNECTTNGFMGDKNDCKKFYRCVDSGNGTYTKYVFSCGEGTLWDPQINACNHAWAVKDCKYSADHVSNVSVTSTTQSSSNEIIDGHDNTNNYAETTNTPSSTAASITVAHSDNKCKSSGFMSDKNDCQKFYRCVDNGDGGFIKHEFKCGDGTVWDSKIEACNHKWAVEGCGGSSNQVVDTTTSSLASNSPIESEATTRTTVSVTSSSSTASTIIQPINDEQSEEPDSSKTTTSVPMSTTGKPKPAGTNVCQEEGYFGDTSDCKKFYRCVNENNGKYTKYDFICGDGTIWDQDITTCNHPYDVKNPSCTSKPESTSPVSTDATSTTSKETPSSSTSTNEPSSTTEEVSKNNDTNSNCNNSTTENPNNANYTCTKAGFYADPNNCKKFYRCVDWENNGKKFSIYHFDCADGTIWDPALETCNHEDSVYPPRNCNGSQQQNENTTETTTDKTTTTTSEPTITTTQSTTTSESTSTQITQTTQSSTTGESTTQSSTTQSSTTEESTTQSSTTLESTTQSSTTQSTTTEESTTQSSTTLESTTQSSTTEASTTTQSSTTDEPTTQSTTTKEPTTEESTTTTTVATTTTNDQSTQQPSTTTETDQDQTTKSSTMQTTNEDKTTTESSTTITQMTTSASDQSSTTTEQSTTTTETSSTTENNSESTTTETSTSKECPDTDNDQYVYVCPTSFKRHPKYCNLFYQCTEDNESHELKIAVFNCPNNTIYDEGKIQCVEEKKSSKKCKGQISQKHRVKRLGVAYNDPFVVTKEAMACRSAGHFPFEKHTECSPSLLKCELTKSGKLRGFVYRCPDGFVYWNISRRCEPLAKVRDCKRSSYKWSTRYDVPLERYNIASK